MKHAIQKRRTLIIELSPYRTESLHHRNKNDLLNVLSWLKTWRNTNGIKSGTILERRVICSV